MKVINSVQGTVALEVSADDVAPPHGFVGNDLINLVGDAYHFAARPALPQGLLPGIMQQLAFQSGELQIGTEKFPIIQLVIRADADIVTSINTEIAEKIIDDYTERLDRELGFKFSTATKRKIFQSNVVVEFEEGIEKKIEALEKIENLLNREIKREDYPFKIKRLAFGFGRTSALPVLSPLTIERSDFLLERLGTEPYEKNRYFCGAPTGTSEHIRILELIERELA
jgi:hypothetical protein